MGAKLPHNDVPNPNFHFFGSVYAPLPILSFYIEFFDLVFILSFYTEFLYIDVIP